MTEGCRSCWEEETMSFWTVYEVKMDISEGLVRGYQTKNKGEKQTLSEGDGTYVRQELGGVPDPRL